MKYHNGQEVLVGDRVRLGKDDGGVVVCSIDRDEYTKEHPRDQWSYLKEGVMIDFPLYGLIHFIKADEDHQLIKRAEAE